MKSINSTIIEKLNKTEHFGLRYDNGRSILWDINAPGLHVLPVSYHFLKFTGEKGKWSLLYHGFTGDFFEKVFDILNRAGLTEEIAPETWGYIKKLNKYAGTNTNPEIKANTNVQLFTFIQDFLENILYKEYVSRTKRMVKDDQDIFKELLVAADSFVARGCDGYIQILAGYPWFDQSWCRDTFISLPGLLLVTERYEYAKSIFSCYAEMQNREGLLPNRVFDSGLKEYNSADCSLWFIEALNRYHLSAKSRDADNFIKKMLPVVNEIIECYINNSGNIYLDSDSLIAVPPRWTWMDASLSGNAITPRNGKPIEIQALFYNALGIASKLYCLCGNRKLAQKYDDIRRQSGRSINERFFTEQRTYPYDVIDGDPRGDAIRPNAVFLISLSCVGDLLPQERKEAIISTIERDLLTPYGLRTLAAQDPMYIGHYNTFDPMEIKDLGYHQGTVWPYLMSHYVAAKKNVAGDKNKKAFIDEIAVKTERLMHFVRDNETICEVFSGNEPHMPGGAVSQAWSIGAILEIFNLINPGIEKNQVKDGEAKKTGAEGAR